MASNASWSASWASASLPRMRTMTRRKRPRWGRTRPSKAWASPACAARRRSSSSGSGMTRLVGAGDGRCGDAPQADGEGGAETPAPGRGPDLAAVALDDLPGQEQAQPGARDGPRHLVAHAVETLEQT